MTTFAEARRIVEAEGFRTAPYGYESDAHWYPVPLPERMGGRTPAVTKATGSLTWVSSTTDEEYVSSRQCGAPRP